MQIELAAKIRDAIAFLRMSRTTTALMTHVPVQHGVQIESCLGCELIVSGNGQLCLDSYSPLGEHPHGDCLALSESCRDVLSNENGLQESIDRNSALRNFTQANSELEGRLSPTREDVAQVRGRAVGRFRKLLDRHFGAGGPAKHRVWF
jgi:hypothetical protein